MKPQSNRLVRFSAVGLLLAGLLLAARPGAAQAPVLEQLEFAHDLAPAPVSRTGRGEVVYPLAAPLTLRLHLRLPASLADSVAVRAVSSQAELGSATGAAAGAAGPHVVELAFRPPATPAVAATDLDLRWEYRVGQGSWQPLAATRHRLYRVLAAPGAPWAGLPEAEGGRALWLAMLEVSCAAAAGTRTPGAAAAAVTGYVYGSRPTPTAATKFQYNPMLPDANLTHLDAGIDRYVVRTQELQALLASLQNPAMTHLQLNCYDAAACVVMLGNALGCTLKRVKVNSTYYLVTHKLVPMGYAKPAKADFRVHCVAWSGPLDERGQVYDACFALPASATAPAFAGLPFGSSRHPGSYAAVVFTNKEEFYLTPLPALVVRRQAPQ